MMIIGIPGEDKQLACIYPIQLTYLANLVVIVVGHLCRKQLPPSVLLISNLAIADFIFLCHLSGWSLGIWPISVLFDRLIKSMVAYFWLTKTPSFQPFIAYKTIRDMVFLLHFTQYWNVIRAVDRNVSQWWFCSWTLAMLFLHFYQNLCHDRSVTHSNVPSQKGYSR